MMWLLLYPLVGLAVFPVLFHLELKRESVKGLGHATALFGATLVLWPIFVVLVPHAQRRDIPAKENEPLRVFEPEKELNFFKESPSRNGYPEAPKELAKPTPVVPKGVEVRPTKPKFASGGRVKMMAPNETIFWFPSADPKPPTHTEITPGLTRELPDQDLDWHIEETINDRRICDIPQFDAEDYRKDEIVFRARSVSSDMLRVGKPKPRNQFKL